ncbi:MAG TPA: RagB/SusD family nutrient uptake outer membrane protein, partial [Chitinophagaceae bacterium]|nr:RagB/SusD family nutrient uptake outer membrane protein [Chitinophagaceae bacterium]
MKKSKYIFILAASLVALIIIQACKKSYLDRRPMGSLSEQVLANKTGVEGLLIGTYAKLGGSQNWGSAPSNWSLGSVVADDAYKGSTPSDQPDVNPLESWAYNANNPYLNEKWVNNYNGIGRANETIRMIAKATDLTADEQKRITAEARFLRGFFHFELKKVFNNIPYVDETITVDNNNTNVTNVEGSGYVNAWPKIEEDLKFAAENLFEVAPNGQIGRINKWGAMAYLAKAYMFQDKYAEAKALFDQIIPNGK